MWASTAHTLTLPQNPTSQELRSATALQNLNHRGELLVNCPVFTVVIVIYHDVKRIWIILVTPDFLYNIYDNEKYYPGEPVNIHIQSLVNIIQEKN